MLKIIRSGQSRSPHKTEFGHPTLLLSLLEEVSHDEAKRNERRETSAGFRRVV